MNSKQEHSQIIVVEDELEALENLLELLEIEGFSAIGFQDGEAALASLQNNPKAILITDLEMPEMNGQMLLQRIQKSQSSRKVIVLSGHPKFEPVDGIIFSFLQKPIDMNDLIREIRNLR